MVPSCWHTQPVLCCKLLLWGFACAVVWLFNVWKDWVTPSAAPVRSPEKKSSSSFIIKKKIKFVGKKMRDCSALGRSLYTIWFLSCRRYNDFNSGDIPSSTTRLFLCMLKAVGSEGSARGTAALRCLGVWGWNKHSAAAECRWRSVGFQFALFLLPMHLFGVSIYCLVGCTRKLTVACYYYYFFLIWLFHLFLSTNNCCISSHSNLGRILLPVSKVKESWPQQQCWGCWIIHIIDFVSASTFVQRDVLFIYLI